MSMQEADREVADQELRGPFEVTDAPTIEAICRFRVEVWRQMGSLAEGAFPDGLWRDPIDADCTHWVVMRGDRLVAAGRLSMHESLAQVHQGQEYINTGLQLQGPIAAPDRLVVCPTAQRQGLAWKLMELQDQVAKEAAARYAVSQVSPGMSRLRVRRGWQLVRPATPDSRFPGVDFQVAYYQYSS